MNPAETRYQKLVKKRLHDQERFPDRRWKHGRWSRNYKLTFPERKAAWEAVRKALESGKLKRASRCEVCGNGAPQYRLVAHHLDYNAPLAIIWLCHPCQAHNHGLAKPPPTSAPSRTTLAQRLIGLSLFQDGVNLPAKGESPIETP